MRQNPYQEVCQQEGPDSMKKICMAPIQLTADAEAVLERVLKSWYTPKLLLLPTKLSY